MTLRDKLDTLRGELEGGGPPHDASRSATATMRRATNDLIASGAASRTLRAGERMPAFTLSDAGGRPVSSRRLLAKGPLVLGFHRGAWCPYCNAELRALQVALPRFQALGASLVAISPQTMANGRRSVRQNGLGFPVLSDPGNEVAADFGLRIRLPAALIAVHRGLNTDLRDMNGDASWTLPMPARFVVGQDGIVLYAEVNPDPTRRPEPEDALPALRRAVAVPA